MNNFSLNYIFIIASFLIIDLCNQAKKCKFRSLQMLICAMPVKDKMIGNKTRKADDFVLV